MTLQKNKVQPCRVVAAVVLSQLLRQQQSLASLLPEYLPRVQENDRGLLQELCFGVSRWFFKLDAIANSLLKKPFKNKDSDIYALLLLGLYQLIYLRTPAHAAINETVNASKPLKKDWARGVLNGTLREFQRNQDSILASFTDDNSNNKNSNDETTYNHPQWFVNRIKHDWPEQWQHICEANNNHPPMTLRVNKNKMLRDEYLVSLKQQDIQNHSCEFSSCGIQLNQAESVQTLPGFFDGHASVQDEAAQLAAGLLDLHPDMRVLDACSAPGGKTCHILESTDNLHVVALDHDKKRLTKVRENLDRLHLTATLLHGDGQHPDSWWDGQLFDRILLDAPCSATGVIRRHPDIKLLRTEQDITSLAETQLALLKALWLTLKPGGLLVYATCSVLQQENEQVIADFLQQQDDAQHKTINANWGIPVQYGRQLFPQIKGHDGFYYACLLRSD